MNDRKAETQTTCTSTTGMSFFECFFLCKLCLLCLQVFACDSFKGFPDASDAILNPTYFDVRNLVKFNGKKTCTNSLSCLPFVRNPSRCEFSKPLISCFVSSLRQRVQGSVLSHLKGEDIVAQNFDSFGLLDENVARQKIWDLRV